jgi:protein TonB
MAFVDTAWNADGVLSLGEVDRLPELAGQIRPEYPEALRATGASGAVELEYVIAANGRIDSGMVRSLISSHPAFTRAAVAALLRARFRPGLRAGRPVAVRVRQRIRFEAR